MNITAVTKLVRGSAGPRRCAPRPTAGSFLRLLLVLFVIALLTPRLQAASRADEEENFEPFTFVVLADPQSRRKHQKPMDLQPVADRIAKLPEKPDHILIVGDLKKGNRDFLGPLLSTEIPVHVVMGNWEGPDERKNLRELFAEDFNGRDYYAFRHKDCLFVATCTAMPGDHVGHLQSESIAGARDGQQYRWLEKQLARTDRATHTFVFGHIPPKEGGGTDGMHLNRQDARFLRELTRRRKPTALFFGHLHRRRRYTIGTARIFVLSTVSWNADDSRLGFLQVRVRQDDIQVNKINLFDSPEEVRSESAQ